MVERAATRLVTLFSALIGWSICSIPTELTCFWATGEYSTCNDQVRAHQRTNYLIISADRAIFIRLKTEEV